MVKVRFNLTQWQEFVDDEIPSFQSGRGMIEFEDTAKGFYFFNSGEERTLRGGGIKASILVTSATKFKTTGAN